MNNKENKAHVQLPNNMTIFTGLKPKDALVYLSLKSFQKSSKSKVFPSLETLAKKCKTSIPTISKCIKNLEENNYIEVERNYGKPNIYRFKKYINFEPFSLKFLDELDIKFEMKAIYVVLQQFTFKEQIDGTGYAKTSIPNEDLARKLNISPRTFRSFIKYMKDKDYLFVNDIRDKNGMKVTLKTFNLTNMLQDIVFTLEEHTRQIQKNTNDIEKLTKRVDELEKSNNYYKNKYEAYKKELQFYKEKDKIVL